MIVYVDREDSLGDFLISFPVLKGLYNSYGKYKLVVKSVNKRFKGFKEFFMYQDIFESVDFDDEMFVTGDVILLHKTDDFTFKGKTNPNQPNDTYRYGQYLKEQYGLTFEIDDKATLICPDFDIEVKDTYYVGDRWDHPYRDYRRGSNYLAYLDKFEFIDYNRTLLENCYILKNLKKPFITSFTGIAHMADLLNVETYIVWRPEFYAPQYRTDNNIVWDDAPTIDDVFKRHCYSDRGCKLIHADELPNVLL
jgi:hypothetical protein